MKKIYSFLLMMIMLCTFTTTVHAADKASAPTDGSAELFASSFVIDQADVLSDSEEKKLNEQLADIYEDQDFGAYVVFIDKIPDGRTVTAYADDIFDYSGCGYGSQKAGSILVVCTDTEKRAITTHGSSDIVKYGDKAVKYIGKKIAKELDDDDYYEAATVYADYFDEFAEKVNDGKNPVPTNWPKTIAISFGIGLVAALVIVLVMKSQLKSVAKQERADYYTREGSMHVTGSRELFLYRTLERTRKPENNGGGGHISSSGEHHGGGEF